MARRAEALSRALDKTPVVILGLSRGVFHHGVLGIARSLGRLGIPVHRVGRERRAPADASRYIASWRTIPVTATDAQTLQVLIDLGREIGRPILVPADDAACVFAD